MITPKTLKILAGVTLVLFVSTAAIGSGRDVLWILDDILFFGFIGCALALIVVSVGVLVRSMRRRSAS